MIKGVLPPQDINPIDMMRFISVVACYWYDEQNILASHSATEWFRNLFAQPQRDITIWRMFPRFGPARYKEEDAKPVSRLTFHLFFGWYEIDFPLTLVSTYFDSNGSLF